MMKKPLFTLIITIFLIGCYHQDQRYFKEVKSEHMGSYFALNCLSCNGSYTKFVEVDRDKEPITNDTLLVWVQHFGKGAVVEPKADSADYILSCHPHLMDQKYREKHLFPFHDNLVAVAWRKDGYVIVTAVDTSKFPEKYPF